MSLAREARPLWRCIECHNQAAPEAMKLGRCPACQAWPAHKPVLLVREREAEREAERRR